jgi:hypothetical protein
MLEEPPLIVRMCGLAGFMDVVLFPFELDSPLPENGTDFQGHCNAGAVRYDARRIILCGTGRRDRCAIDPPARFASRWLDARHLLSDWAAIIYPIGIQLDSRKVRVEVIDEYLGLKDVLCRTCLYLHLAEAKRAPFLF